MAIYLKGLTNRETGDLAQAMINTGKSLNFEGDDIVDKHSTGGVGDKTSFIVAPLANVLGVRVPMMAGRGLGHSGGTIDKIEAINGIKVALSTEQFSSLFNQLGAVITTQTNEMAPADKKLYALRDVTATVESIPLIVASILSKKIAEGAKGLVLDVKVGNGAFMSTYSNAQALAQCLRKTATILGCNIVTTITDMNSPLGHNVGNSLEIIEAIETLKGRGPKDVVELSLHLVGHMAWIAGKAKNAAQGISLAKEALASGLALKKFGQMIEAQGGDPLVLKDYNRLPLANKIAHIKARQRGFVSKFNTKKIGLHFLALGGGRVKLEDKIDLGVGLSFPYKIGDAIEANNNMALIYYNEGQEKVVEEIALEIINNDCLIEKKTAHPTSSNI